MRKVVEKARHKIRYIILIDTFKNRPNDVIKRPEELVVVFNSGDIAYQNKFPIILILEPKRLKAYMKFSEK